MIQDALSASREILSPPFRAVLVKSLALTIGLLVAAWALLQWLIGGAVTAPWPWLDAAFSVLTGIGLVIGMGFLVAPVTALMAGLFLDDIAEVVERKGYPGDPVGRAPPFWQGLAMTLRFLIVVIAVNLVALPLVLFVGFGVVIFLAANAYLLGREYFQLAALRFHDEATVRGLRLRHSGRVFAAGLVIAGCVAIPFVNLLTPLFATAFMVHLHKRIEADERRTGGLLAG